METRFTWDSRKAKVNEQRHGISFNAAREVFADPNHVVSENYYMPGQDEQRSQIIGMTQSLVLLLVVFVDCSNADAEIIRIISARKATKYEQTIYIAAQG